MTKNHPALRRAASNADLYADPVSLPRRHASVVLGRAHTTAGRGLRGERGFGTWGGVEEGVQGRGGSEREEGSGQRLSEGQSWDEKKGGSQRQQGPPVPPKILEGEELVLEFRDGEYRRPLKVDCKTQGASQSQVASTPVASQPQVAKPPSHPWLPAQLPPAPVRRAKESPEQYTKPFTDFMTANPTVFHAVDAVAKDLERAGYKKLSERDAWDLQTGGKYYVDRNGTSLIAFAIGDKFKAGNGAAIVAGHIDALTAKLKPIPKLRNKAGYVQLGVAPYAGALSDTWWDRDLGIGGRVLVKEHGKIVTKLVKLDWPIARIPTLAPHFGAAANGPFNRETQMVPIIGLDNSDIAAPSEWQPSPLGGEGAFAATQPERLVKAISSELGITDCAYLH